MCDRTVEDNTTRATARLPVIEIIHRRSLNEAEQIAINLQAMPSFEAFGRFLETTNPFALWAQTFQIACLPWLNAVRSATLPWSIPSVPAKPTSSGDNPPANG